MRFYIKVENRFYSKIKDWVERNLVNNVPSGTNSNNSKLSVSEGKKYIHIKFDITEVNGVVEYNALDSEMTKLLLDFDSKFKEKYGCVCWWEFAPNSSTDKKVEPSNHRQVILHKKGSLNDKEGTRRNALRSN